jgi:hypothetical protein
MFLSMVGQRHGQTALELLQPSWTISGVLGRSHTDESIQQTIRVAERLGDGDRARSPLDSPIDIGGRHAELGAVAVRHSELASRRELLEDRHRFRREAFSIRANAAKPPQAR